jgi:hypothetical protein
MAPPWSALPRTVLEHSSRHGAPQRMPALPRTAACWEQGVRNLAGTVRMLGRSITPVWRTWLTWLSQWSPYPFAPRPQKDGYCWRTLLLVLKSLNI